MRGKDITNNMRIGDMKRTTKNAWRILVAFALVLVVAGCDDGSLATGMNPDITPPAPMVIKFAAEPSTINSGESTTISWEVAGADNVEITAVSSTGAPVSFDIQTEDLSGAAPVTLTSTTDFVLTATKSADNLESEEGEAEGEEGGEEAAAQKTKGGQIQFGPEVEDEIPEPSGSATPAVSSVSQTITVTVVAADELTAFIEAQKPSVLACEQTIISWTVTPSENITVQVTADTGEAISPTDQCSGSITDILGQPAVETTPAVGCAVVAPCEDTTYTVKATDASGNEATDSASIGVEGDVTAKIKAGNNESTYDSAEDIIYMVESFQQSVAVHWQATPEAAKVTITASPAATCDEELPSAAEGKTSGSINCTLSGETKFSISAQLGSADPVIDEVVVTAGGGAAGLVVADMWAFEGEAVALDMKLTSSSVPTSVAKLTVNGTAIDSSLLESLKAGQEIKVPNVIATAPNVKIALLDSVGSELYSTEKVQVIELVVDKIDDDEAAVSSIEYNAAGTSFVGVQRAGFQKGEGRVYIDGSAKHFDFGKAIMNEYNMGDMWNEDFFDYIDTYPVAVTSRVDMAEHVFAGTTGALMWSKDGGVSWEKAMVSRRIAGPNYEKPDVPEAKFGDHLSCGRADYVEFGGPKIQKGSKMRKEAGDIISLNQMCDIFVSKDGWAIVATDFGVQVEKNLDNNLDNDDFVWIGTPKEGVTQQQLDDGGILTYGKIANDIEVITDASGNIEKVYAATVNPHTFEGAVYVSDDGGIHWEQVGSSLPAVYALKYDARNQAMYVGTEMGLFVKEAGSDTISGTALADPVLSIAIDEHSPATKMTIMAGTPTGVQVSRDSGSSWVAMAVNGGEEAAVEAMAISSKAVGSNVKYGIAIGSTAGQLIQKVTVGGTDLSEDGDTSIKRGTFNFNF